MTAEGFIGSIINRLRHGAERRKMSRKKIIDLDLSKKGMTTVLKIKVVPEIEDYFREASLRDTELGSDSRSRNSRRENTSVSDKWTDPEGEGLEFYRKNVKLSNKVSHYSSVIDNFGNGLLDDGRLNLALLRIVGISGDSGVTIKTDDLLGHEEMKAYIEQLALWTKAFYEDHLHDQELSASITFEVE